MIGQGFGSRSAKVRSRYKPARKLQCFKINVASHGLTVLREPQSFDYLPSVTSYFKNQPGTFRNFWQEMTRMGWVKSGSEGILSVSRKAHGVEPLTRRFIW